MYVYFAIKHKHGKHINNKSSERSMKFPALLGNYDRTTNRRTKRPTDGHDGSLESYTSNDTGLSRICVSFLYKSYVSLTLVIISFIHIYVSFWCFYASILQI